VLNKAQGKLHLFLAYFHSVENIKVGLWDHLAVCVSVRASPQTTFKSLYRSSWNLVCVSCDLRLFQQQTS
jgi:hypothetical protein